jgi:hypothetical protein
MTLLCPEHDLGNLALDILLNGVLSSVKIAIDQLGEVYVYLAVSSPNDETDFL